jgi:hypothetical protein
VLYNRQHSVSEGVSAFVGEADGIAWRAAPRPQKAHLLAFTAYPTVNARRMLDSRLARSR